MEAAHEIHNRIAANVVQRLVREIPDMINRLIALESIVVGIIGTLPLKVGGDEAVLGILFDGARKRLTEQRLVHGPSAGLA